jgi:hypothetical protein
VRVAGGVLAVAGLLVIVLAVAGTFSTNGSSTGASAGQPAGFGGATTSAIGLEQIGTESAVVAGRAIAGAWYELYPAPSKPLSLAIHPGDAMSAKVVVEGTAVTVSLADSTTGASVTKRLHMSSPDTASAEWIAEAPSTATSTGGTRVLPLADFGTVGFTNAVASASGHTGSITDPSWTPERVHLVSETGPYRGPGPGWGGAPPSAALDDGADANATSSPLETNRAFSDFTVTWRPSRTSTDLFENPR